MENQVLISLPQNVTAALKNGLQGLCPAEYYCDSDPAEGHLGSGAGAIWLLDGWLKSDPEAERKQRRIIVHSGGESRRLPAYAPEGKVFTPIPVMRWSVGEPIDKDLLQMQLPLYDKLLEKAPEKATTLIASGDVCVRADVSSLTVPDADVVCLGVWAEPQQASHHGVFVCRRDSSDRLDFMLQKPDVATLTRLSDTHYYLMDAGVWLLSERAVEALRRKSTDPQTGQYHCYDLYGQMGCALGENPSAPDPEIRNLSVAIVPLGEGAFYHFGTTRELISSTVAMQSLVSDQRRIMRPQTKLSASIFVQNCVIEHPFDAGNDYVWVENAHIGPRWSLSQCNAVTGVPANDWQVKLEKGMCVDVVPVTGGGYAVRTYGFDDPMRGPIGDSGTLFMGATLKEWTDIRDVAIGDPDDTDIQYARVIPVARDMTETGILVRWLTTEPHLEEGRRLWNSCERLSASEVCYRADLDRILAQRRAFRNGNIDLLAGNWKKSVFYQLDLDHLAHLIASESSIKLPEVPEDADTETAMRCHILRSRVERLRGVEWKSDEDAAFEDMRLGIIGQLRNRPVEPRMDVCIDQIVWSRSPVRIDLAGGWTDTAPYALQHGGAVVNVAVELNGQPPLQVFIKPCREHHIVLRSIDLGATETVRDYDTLMNFHHVGSPFTLPKAALALAGFSRQFGSGQYGSLEEQLKTFGSGLELTLLAAVPAGSGLGTSSILAATILRALGDFCGLGWDTYEICFRTLALEQLLTSGGGWQDQFGGGLHGVKLLHTDAGWLQRPASMWLPDTVFTDPRYAPCHLLYYTGITRTAKSILAEIVKRMMLNSGKTLGLLHDMKAHAAEMASILQRGDFKAYGQAVERTWHFKKMLDNGTDPEAVRHIISLVQDYTDGVELPGAGGGGFLYMVAKDPEAASRIRKILEEANVNPRARMVEMSVSATGIQVSRS